MECKARVRGKPCDFTPLEQVCRFCGAPASKNVQLLKQACAGPIYQKADPPLMPMRRLSPEELEKLYRLVRRVEFPYNALVPVVVEDGGQFFVMEQELFQVGEPVASVDVDAVGDADGLKPTDPTDKRLWRRWCDITKTWRKYDELG